MQNSQNSRAAAAPESGGSEGVSDMFSVSLLKAWSGMFDDKISGQFKQLIELSLEFGETAATEGGANVEKELDRERSERGALRQRKKLERTMKGLSELNVLVPPLHLILLHLDELRRFCKNISCMPTFLLFQFQSFSLHFKYM